MPRISEFFGIVIYMYWMDTQKHKAPHFHARYRGREAVFSLAGDCLNGNIGSRAQNLVLEWCRESQEALWQAWGQAVTGKEVPWIKPLQ